MRRVMILAGTVKQTPRGFAELVNSGVVKQDVSNGNDVLAEWEHGKCCVNKNKININFAPSFSIVANH